MRINVYSQELTKEVEQISKVADTGIRYYGVRMILAPDILHLILASPDILHFTDDDDDRSAITFWIPNATSFSKEDLAEVFESMADEIRNCPDPEPN